MRTITVQPETFGSVHSRYCNPDGKAVFRFLVPWNEKSRKYAIPFRIFWNGRYLGQFRHAVVSIV
ncbi:MAG: hypothetical protein Q7J78_00015 [Clostridiales bacterium]|nr:hypothetical protein [Clostridiales bacterium]